MMMNSQPSTDPTDIRPLVSNPTVRDLRPSYKLIWLVLDRNGEATQKALIEATGLSTRTVRSALVRLEEDGLITERVYLQDARLNVYSVID